MPFFKVGALTVELQSKGGASLTREPVGPVFETANGGIRSMRKAYRRVWQGDTPPMLDADATAVVAEIGLGLQTVGGDWPGTEDIGCFIEVLNDVPVKDDAQPLGAQRILTIKARETLA